MTDFLDHLLARNLPAERSQRGRAEPQAWLRPRVPSLFESASKDTAATNMAIAEPPAALDDEADAQLTADQPANTNTLQHHRLRAVRARTAPTQPDQRVDRSAARAPGRNAPPTASAAAAFPDRVAAAHNAPLRTALKFDADDSEAIAIVAAMRPDANRRDRTEHRATYPQPMPSQPTLPTPPGETERHIQAPLTRHADVKPAVGSPIDSASALPAVPQHPAGLNAVTPTMLDAALRAGLQALAMRPHDQTRSPALDKDSPGGGVPTRQTIQVSIGRIEIRATHSGASTAASARKDRSGPQPLGLDDYLRQRASGVRE